MFQTIFLLRGLKNNLLGLQTAINIPSLPPELIPQPRPVELFSKRSHKHVSLRDYADSWKVVQNKSQVRASISCSLHPSQCPIPQLPRKGYLSQAHKLNSTLGYTSNSVSGRCGSLICRDRVFQWTQCQQQIMASSLVHRPSPFTTFITPFGCYFLSNVPFSISSSYEFYQ